MQSELSLLIAKKTDLMNKDQNRTNILHVNQINDHKYLDIMFSEQFYTQQYKKYKER